MNYKDMPYTMTYIIIVSAVLVRIRASARKAALVRWLGFTAVINSLHRTQIVVARYQIPEDFVVTRRAVLVFDFP